MEVPAGVTGTIDSVTVAVGDKVAEGQVIARLKARQEQPDEQEQPEAQEQRESPAEKAEREEPSRDGESVSEPAPTAEAQQREVDVTVPDIGEAENVEVIEVAVKAGDQVDTDDLLVVVESDKASLEIPSTHSGTVKEVHVSVGTQVEEGTRLVTLEVEAEAQPIQADAPRQAEEKDQPEGKQPPEPVRDRTAGAREALPTSAEVAPGQAEEDVAAPAAPGTSVYAGPAVRRLARELGVDLAAVEGTGNRGRVVKDDVKAHVKKRMAGGAGAAAAALPGMPEVDFSRFGEIEEQPLSRIRARGAENLHRSWLNVPHVTQHDDVDVTDLEDFRASLKAEGEQRGVKVTPLAFIIKACCQVLKEFPTFNASLDPAAKTFILKRYYHIGMAVDTPDGLVVPVIHDADRKGIWELSAEVTQLAAKARDKKLGVGDLQGGSFSVSSLGAIGGTGFTPIINAPEVAILGVGRLTMRPVWRDEAFLPRKMLPLSLSYDHRAVNGAEAGRFVARLGQLLADIRHLAL
jgi:pyruvate dehydrogenase E2 component (dihydrolipoamide acetyltransferase)